MQLSELLDRAEQSAVGIAGAPEPQVDREITAYVVYPHAVRAVYRKQARTGRHLNNLSRAFPIEIVAGKGTLSNEIFREYLDRSYLPQVQFASLVPFDAYMRNRLNNQLKYYANRDSAFYYSGPVPILKASPICTASATSSTITGDASAGAVGDRFALTDGTNGLVVDATIASINGTTDFTVRGKTLVATTAPTAGSIYNGQDDTILTTFNDFYANTSSQTIGSRTASTFTSKMIGRRVRAYQTGTETIIVDGVVDSVPNSHELILRTKPLSTVVAGDASILFSPLLLQTIGIPALPIDICDNLDLAPEVAEDVILVIASVLRGEVQLQSLMEPGGTS